MALREVLQFPDPRLERVCEPITEVTDTLHQLARDMCEVLYGESGIGLAAPQVGEEVRLIVVDTEWCEEGAKRDPLILFNPELRWKEGQTVWNEACLSVPDFAADVERFGRIAVHGRGLDGAAVVEEAEGLRAACLQHEIDHLDGVLFIDRISRLKRSMYVKKRMKQLRAEREGGVERARGSGL